MSDYLANEDNRSNAWKSAKRAEGQDVYLSFKDQLEAGPADPERRASCRYDFLKFCEEYGGDAFSLKWSPNHIRAGELIQAVALDGECFAFAMPRGSGKTTLARWAVVWATLYGHSPYSVLIGKTAKSANKLLKSIKTSLRFSSKLFEDFPDAISPIKHLKGETRRASGQKFQGEPTLVEWAQEIIVFANYPPEWIKTVRAKFGNDYCSACGSVLDVAGIEGEIRGRQFERTDGSIIRPRFVVVDDPQDRESARSLSQCDERELTLKADIKYLAGPDEPTGVLVPCTVIYENDFADRILDRTRNPEWQGEKSKLLISFPGEGLLDSDKRAVEQHWEEYRRIREESLQNGNKGREANEYFRTHREAMECGAQTSWPERYFPGELSAIHHAMNLYLSDETSFQAEYQNSPIRSSEAEIVLPEAREIQVRLSGVSRQTVPLECHKLTAMIDISGECLWWVVVAWGDGFSGSVIDYGVFPEQSRNYVTLSTIRSKMTDVAAKALNVSSCGFESALLWSLESLCGQILDRPYQNENGTEFRVSRCLIDTNWNQSTAVVNSFCRRGRLASMLLPSRGRGVTSPDDGLVSPRGKPKPGETRGIRCKILPNRETGRYLLYDTNYWKTFAINRLSIPVGDPGAISLFQDRASAHKMFAEQMVAESCKRKKVQESEFDKWTNEHDRDNHFFDCLVGAAVAASLAGISLAGISLPKRQTKRRKRRGGVSYLNP